MDEKNRSLLLDTIPYPTSIIVELEQLGIFKESYIESLKDNINSKDCKNVTVSLLKCFNTINEYNKQCEIINEKQKILEDEYGFYYDKSELLVLLNFPVVIIDIIWDYFYQMEYVSTKIKKYYNCIYKDVGVQITYQINIYNIHTEIEILQMKLEKHYYSKYYCYDESLLYIYCENLIYKSSILIIFNINDSKIENKIEIINSILDHYDCSDEALEVENIYAHNSKLYILTKKENIMSCVFEIDLKLNKHTRTINIKRGRDITNHIFICNNILYVCLEYRLKKTLIIKEYNLTQKKEIKRSKFYKINLVQDEIKQRNYSIRVYIINDNKKYSICIFYNIEKEYYMALYDHHQNKITSLNKINTTEIKNYNSCKLSYDDKTKCYYYDNTFEILRFMPKLC